MVELAPEQCLPTDHLLETLECGSFVIPYYAAAYRVDDYGIFIEYPQALDGDRLIVVNAPEYIGKAAARPRIPVMSNADAVDKHITRQHAARH
jgi:hypothetical protein